MLQVLVDVCLLSLLDEVPAEYWQILAERRREALEDALDENKKVVDINTVGRFNCFLNLQKRNHESYQFE